MIEDFNKVPEMPAIMGPAKQIAYMVDDIDAAMRGTICRCGTSTRIRPTGVSAFLPLSARSAGLASAADAGPSTWVYSRVVSRRAWPKRR